MAHKGNKAIENRREGCLKTHGLIQNAKWLGKESFKLLWLYRKNSNTFARNLNLEANRAHEICIVYPQYKVTLMKQVINIVGYALWMQQPQFL